jgi:hypothetical protein
MKNQMKKQTLLIVVVLFALILGSIPTFAQEDSQDYGHIGAANDTEYTLEEMLQYAIQDEYLALSEYEYIITDLGADRPFSNIMKAEQSHIDAIELLYNTYGIAIPVVDPSSLLYLPVSVEEALTIGVQAEIDNIAMYEAFLSQDLPDDVRITFENLQKASESHLSAFENNLNNISNRFNNDGTGAINQGSQFGRNR